MVQIKRFFAIFMLVVPATLFAGSKEILSVGDVKNGERLHNSVCVACHTTSVYTRPNRVIKTYGGLVGRVGGCSMQLKLDFSRDQVNDVVAYLNANFYKLDPEK